MTSLQLPPREPGPLEWPGWTGERRPMRPGPALAALIEERTASWPYFRGVRVGPNHLDHDKHGDRETNR